jgi:hypothetical protein
MLRQHQKYAIQSISEFLRFLQVDQGYTATNIKELQLTFESPRMSTNMTVEIVDSATITLTQKILMLAKLASKNNFSTQWIIGMVANLMIRCKLLKEEKSPNESKSHTHKASATTQYRPGCLWPHRLEY